MPNNPYFRRAQVGYTPVLNKTSRSGRVAEAIVVSNKTLTTPELGSPSGGPAGVVSGGIGASGGGGSAFQLNLN